MALNIMTEMTMQEILEKVQLQNEIGRAHV